MKDYHINSFYREDDECGIAGIPDLKYGSAHGDTPEEALQEVLIAQEGWLLVTSDCRFSSPNIVLSSIKLGCRHTF